MTSIESAILSSVEISEPPPGGLIVGLEGGSETFPLEIRPILLVEDCDDDASLFAHVAAKSGSYTLVRAANASEALSALSTIVPSLIVLDSRMPGKSGLELLADLRQAKELDDVPIVMLSGASSEHDVILARRLGANSFIRKPSSYEDYVESVRMILELWISLDPKNLKRAAVTSDPPSRSLHPNQVVDLGEGIDGKNPWLCAVA